MDWNTQYCKDMHFPNLSTNPIQYKSKHVFFLRCKVDLKFILNAKDKNNQDNLENKKCEPFLKANIKFLNDSMILCKNRQLNPWNRIGSSETDLHIFGHLIYEKGGTAEQWGKGWSFP